METHTANAISDAVNRCNELGHTVARNFFDTDTVASLRDEVEALFTRGTGTNNVMYFFAEKPSGDRKMVRVERIWEALPSLAAGEAGRRLFQIAEEYFGDSVSIFKDKVNIRSAGSKGYAPHQDSAAGWNEFADRFLSIGLFLGPSNPESGGFEVVDHAHRLGRLNNDKGKMSVKDFMEFQPYGLYATAGDILLLDSEAPHRTLDNLSETDNYHLLITFAAKKRGDLRSAYYSKKAADFDGNPAHNEFKFRVFSFE